MASCLYEDCVRPAERSGLCYRHYLKTINIHPGQLVNRLHPGLTMKESQRKIVADAAKSGIDAVPVETGSWT
jgi:hypothetical protein